VLVALEVDHVEAIQEGQYSVEEVWTDPLSAIGGQDLKQRDASAEHMVGHCGYVARDDITIEIKSDHHAVAVLKKRQVGLWGRRVRPSVEESVLVRGVNLPSVVSVLDRH